MHPGMDLIMIINPCVDGKEASKVVLGGLVQGMRMWELEGFLGKYAWKGH